MDRKIIRKIKTNELNIDSMDTMKWDHLTGKDRMELYKKCGRECFMRPASDEKEIETNPQKALKFPICRKNNCTVSASGVLAANRRARLTRKYPDVVDQTARLIKELGLTKKARQETAVVKNVRLTPDGNKFAVQVIYTNGSNESLTRPMTAPSILKKYWNVLTLEQKYNLMKK